MIRITMKRRRDKTKINCWTKIKIKRRFRIKMIIIIKVIKIDTKLIEN